MLSSFLKLSACLRDPPSGVTLSILRGFLGFTVTLLEMHARDPCFLLVFPVAVRPSSLLLVSSTARSVEAVENVEKLDLKVQEVKQDLQVSMEKWVFKVSWDLKVKKVTQVKEVLKVKEVYKEIVQMLLL